MLEALIEVRQGCRPFPFSVVGCAFRRKWVLVVRVAVAIVVARRWGMMLTLKKGSKIIGFTQNACRLDSGHSFEDRDYRLTAQHIVTL